MKSCLWQDEILRFAAYEIPLRGVEKRGLTRGVSPRFSERACKPGSVRAKRVTAIYLRRALPRVCVPPADMPDRHRACLGGPRRTAVRGERRRDSAYGVAPDRVYICTQSPAVPVSFYLAFPSVPSGGRAAVLGRLFLLHFPGSRLRRTLSVILSCGARTFLTPAPFGVRHAAVPPARVNYILMMSFCQAKRNSHKVVVYFLTVSYNKKNERKPIPETADEQKEKEEREKE